MISSISYVRREGQLSEVVIHIEEPGQGHKKIRLGDLKDLALLQQAAERGRAEIWRVLRTLDLTDHYPDTDAGKDELIAVLLEG